MIVSDKTNDKLLFDSGSGELTVEGLLGICPSKWEVNSFSVSGTYSDAVVHIIAVPADNNSCGNLIHGKCSETGVKCGMRIMHLLEPKEVYISGESANYKRELEIHPEGFKWIL